MARVDADQNAALAACSPAEAVIEETAGRWLIELLGLPSQSSFAFTSGCQLAHITALAAARRHLLCGLGHDPESEGLAGGPRMHVVTGTHGHHSVDRAVRILGIGSKHLHHVPTVDGRIDPRVLFALLGELGDAPVAVCLSAGDINTGDFDDFRTVIPLCHARGNTWVHIDGAFGLWARVSQRFAHLLEGIEAADSWATDGHKWLNTPFDVGFLAVRHRDPHLGAMSIRAPYLTHDAAARDQIDWNPEWSRRGRSVPVFAVVRALGRQGIADIVDRCCDAAAGLVQGVGEGQGIHWEDIDEDISVEGLLAGKRSGESMSSSARWLKASRQPKFQPWKGKGYGRSSNLGLPTKLLILGESHYGDPEDWRRWHGQPTKGVVGEYCNEGGYPFFTKILRTVMGPETPTDTTAHRSQFFNSIAFSNYVQRSVGDTPEIPPTREMWEEAAAPFRATLEYLRPTHIVACGMRLWDHMPDNVGFWTSPPKELTTSLGSVPTTRPAKSIVGCYRHSEGQSMVLAIHHPSWKRYQPSAWYPVVRRFLKYDASRRT